MKKFYNLEARLLSGIFHCTQRFNFSFSILAGSVDDHFARALGNRTWSELKAKNDSDESTQPGSVDDHFAKALGDTWLKIKAEKETTRSNHSFPISHQLPHPHPIPHPIPHPHAHVLPMSQRSSPPTTQHSTSLLST